MSKVAIFASGSGSNAENIVNHLKGRLKSSDFHFFTNKPDAYVNERARKLNIQLTLFSKNEFYNSDKILKILINGNFDLIVLAGFLWLMPLNIVQAFNGRIINIHPALLPKYGGKGMYGKRVHEAVVANNEIESGITIHFVDENYDEGKVIKQEHCAVLPSDTAEDVERKIHDLEFKHFPKVVEELLWPR
ncbi:formyltetrahydrofolate-dependent phosphoribosylglycinamide formyltransferase [Saccharicrinis carchari]|uniref:phosphoribosylglycinamide formyltransferase 1 n=1 Tax=Saccharicrinis carchari TaxID=1168039 RepID=A0A521E9Q4_SACCC|nr:phosphoribosylglycinamide formyltransferase [Saccharicrinis carchari]SMO80639.1 formyltetrahydrofolate-dependent phosphoribosylglycinamide formyltransferase [Saccharicrinis carchari]